MLIKFLQQQLTIRPIETARSQMIFWGCLSLAFAGVFGIQVLQQAFSSQFVVQDDARQHLFWMARFVDPALFPNDLIADYFQSVAPWGYRQFYHLFAAIGISPLLLSKLLPAVLALLITGYCFALSLALLPIPATAFVATLLFNQNLWMRDDLASVSPRAFLNLFFLAFLYYLLQGSLLPSLAAIALLGFFYPQYVFIAAGILLMRLWHWENGQIRITQDQRQLRLCLAGLGVALLVLLPFALTSSQFGPTISVAEAKALPEFAATGRARFFFDDWGRYWLSGGRSGIQPPLDPPLLALGLLLPLLLRFPQRFLLLRQAKHLDLLSQLTLVSLGMFFAAHALLFKLHLPSRYTQHSLRVVMALAAAIVLTVLIDALLRWAAQRQPLQRLVAIGLVCVTGAVLVLYPVTLSNFPRTTYITGTAPPLYQFFAQQPASIVIASLSEEANNLPVFAQRSILVGSEYAIPYHVGYYRQFRQRVLDLLEAQYSDRLEPAQALIPKYGIRFWLVDRAAFSPAYLADNSWLRQYQPVYNQALQNLTEAKTPALAKVLPRCTSFGTGNFVVLDAACIANVPPGDNR